MSKLVELLNDVYPFGCKGDIVRLEDEAMAELKKLASKHKLNNAYKEVTPVAPKVKDDVKSKPDTSADAQATSKPAPSK